MKLKIYLTSCSGDFYPELCMVRCWNVPIPINLTRCGSDRNGPEWDILSTPKNGQ